LKKSYRQLFVWKSSVDLAVRMIALADGLIASKRFALADQLIRAACSVPNNIAEGDGRFTNANRRHFLVQAPGSLYELETLLEILVRAKIAIEDAGIRSTIAQLEAGLTRMIQHRVSSNHTL
jgi:four helix bundle protein